MKREERRDLILDEYDRNMATRLIKGETTDADFKEFNGRNLLCFCKPKRCHGDTLVILYYMTPEERLEWADEILALYR